MKLGIQIPQIPVEKSTSRRESVKRAQLATALKIRRANGVH